MALHSPLPYEVLKKDELNYEFVNRDGIKYHLFFMPVLVSIGRRPVSSACAF